MDLQDGFIARFKGNARPLMQRQFNHSVRVGKGKGSMKLSVVLRMIQLAASQAHGPAKNLRGIQRVSFFVNTDYSPPRLDYDPLNRGDFKNSFAAPAAKLAANVVDFDAIPMSTHEQRVQAVVALAKAEVASLVGAMADFDTPPVPEVPQETIGRGRASRVSANRHGLVISSPSFTKYLADKAKKQQGGVDAKQEKKNAKARKFARTWLPLARTAKAALKARQGTALRGGGARPSSSPLRSTTVGDMKTLTAGRTGELPKAKNNKDGATRGT
jgi:hypothetical protein